MTGLSTFGRPAVRSRPTTLPARVVEPGGGRGAAEVVVDLDAIEANARVFAARTTSTVMAVVKADAFGHGAVATARPALAGGARWLGVASTAEALALRDAGIDAPVLSWLHSPDEDLTRAIGAGVALSAASTGHLDAIARAAATAGQRAAVHLKIDTGLSRGAGTRSTGPTWSRGPVATNAAA